jgi:hypothetical protein
MEILKKKNESYNIVLNQEQTFLTNLGWDENMKQFEDEILETIIDPIKNYETIRYIHTPYSGLTNNTNDLQSDIWFKFYFIDNNGNYSNGLDYSLVGITPKENSRMLKQTTESFFKLEFFKTPNDEPPTRINRKLVFSKNIYIPMGEKFFYNTLMQNIFIPVFNGTNYKNKELIYLFWFQDDTVLSGTSLDSNVFFVTAKFFNAKDGTIADFTTSGLTVNKEIIEQQDMYYKVVLNKNNHSYEYYKYDGTTGDRVGKDNNNPIKFYETRAS